MMTSTETQPIDNGDDLIDVRDVIDRMEELKARTECDECGEPAHIDPDNGAGQPITVHDHGSTVCYDDPAGSIEDGDTVTTATLSDPLDNDEIAELASLVTLLDELRGNGGDHQYEGDWYPATVIRDSYFEDYARELAEDIGAIPADASWPAYCIDWSFAARELRMDYTAVDFDGVTYWTR